MIRTSWSRKRYDIAGRGEDNDQNWLITFSDFLTLLLVFFIMFYMMTRGGGKDRLLQEEKKQSSQGIMTEGGASRITNTVQDVNNTISRLQLNEHISAVNINNEVVITLKEKILFRPANAGLLNDAYPALNVISDIIKSNRDFQIEIEGHTDNVPINNRFYASNWELSMARAISVLRYFTDSQGIEASRFSIKGNADNKPLTTNTDVQQRSSNRRVEIRLKESRSM